MKAQKECSHNDKVVDTRAPVRALLPALWREPTQEETAAMLEKQIHFSRKNPRAVTQTSQKEWCDLFLPDDTKKVLMDEEQRRRRKALKAFETEIHINQETLLTSTQCLKKTKVMHWTNEVSEQLLRDFCANGRKKPVTMASLKRNKVRKLLRIQPGNNSDADIEETSTPMSPISLKRRR